MPMGVSNRLIEIRVKDSTIIVNLQFYKASTIVAMENIMKAIKCSIFLTQEDLLQKYKALPRKNSVEF